MKKLIVLIVLIVGSVFAELPTNCWYSFGVVADSTAMYKFERDVLLDLLKEKAIKMDSLEAQKPRYIQRPAMVEFVHFCTAPYGSDDPFHALSAQKFPSKIDSVIRWQIGNLEMTPYVSKSGRLLIGMTYRSNGRVLTISGMTNFPEGIEYEAWAYPPFQYLGWEGRYIQIDTCQNFSLELRKRENEPIEIHDTIVIDTCLDFADAIKPPALVISTPTYYDYYEEEVAVPVPNPDDTMEYYEAPAKKRKTRVDPSLDAWINHDMPTYRPGRLGGNSLGLKATLLFQLGRKGKVFIGGHGIIPFWFGESKNGYIYRGINPVAGITLMLNSKRVTTLFECGYGHQTDWGHDSNDSSYEATSGAHTIRSAVVADFRGRKCHFYISPEWKYSFNEIKNSTFNGRQLWAHEDPASTKTMLMLDMKWFFGMSRRVHPGFYVDGSYFFEDSSILPGIGGALGFFKERIILKLGYKGRYNSKWKDANGNAMHFFITAKIVK